MSCLIKQALCLKDTMPKPFGGLAPIAAVPFARLPSQAWADFMAGELSDLDWVLIGRVERGEIGVDEAMRTQPQSQED